MATIKRGTGRQALIEATADVLRAGGDVQVKEVARAAGVSHTLIYRHFPDGGREELIGESYGHLFRGLALADADQLLQALADPANRRARMRALGLAILDPSRSKVRASRLEALAQTRVNPYTERHIESARKEMIERLASGLVAIFPHIDPQRARSISMLILAIPLGLAAVTGTRMAKADREGVVDEWVDAVMTWIG